MVVQQEEFDERFSKAPTEEELDHLRETRNLFKSNLLKLEIDELLSHVQQVPSKKMQVSIREYLVDLKTFLEGMKEKKNVKGFKIETGFDEDILLNFAPCVDVSVVGSFMVDSMLRAHKNIDVALTIPSSCFDSKDYLNKRYFQKRAAYLWCVAKALQKNADLATDVSFAAFNGDCDKPVIVITPGDHLKDYTIRLLPVIEDDVFPIRRFGPRLNNFEGGFKAPTPHYSMSILEDISSASVGSHLKILNHVTEKAKSFSDVCLLLKVWAKQRGFTKDQSADTFNGFLLVMLAARLIVRKQINEHTSPQQMFKSVIGFIAKTDFFTEAIHMSNDAPDSGYEDATMFGAFPVVFMSGRFNLAWRVSRMGMMEVQQQAKVTTELLDKNAVGGRDLFEAVFSTKINFWLSYDKYLTVSCPSISKSFLNERSRVDYLQTEAVSLLESALTDRVTFIRVIPRQTETQTWKINEKPPRVTTLVVCLHLDPLEAFRPLDKGPSAEDSNLVDTFREFWGEKSELRRFKDGSIVETLDWTSSKDICHDIAQYVFARKEPFKTGCSLIGDHLDNMIMKDTNSKPVFVAFDSLSDRLRKLALPLQVLAVSPTAPELRYTSLKPVESHVMAFGYRETGESKKRRRSDASRFVRAIHVVLQLESSGKWPSNPEAIAKTKTAFYVEIASQLHSKFKGLQVCQVSEDYVDVLTSGFAFRLLLKVDKTSSVVVPTASWGGGADASHRAEIVSRMPLLHLQLHAVNTQLGSHVMGPVTSLAKRWMAGHFLWSQISEAAIELLVASVFLHPQPYQPPKSISIGFFRFLELLANWDWDNSPLVLNLGETLTAENYSDIVKRFNEVRDRAGGPSMYLVTPEDHDGVVWTSSTTKDALARIVQVASDSLALLNHLFACESAQEHVDEILWSALFHSSAEDVGFDAVLTVSTEHRTEQSLLVGVDVAADLVELLTKTYGHLALFYYNPIDSSEIGIRWKKDIMKPVPLRVAVAGMAQPAGDDVVVPNITEIFADITSMAGSQTILGIEIF